MFRWMVVGTNRAELLLVFTVHVLMHPFLDLDIPPLALKLFMWKLNPCCLLCFGLILVVGRIFAVIHTFFRYLDFYLAIVQKCSILYFPIVKLLKVSKLSYLQ